jgi:hypothetical protein
MSEQAPDVTETTTKLGNTLQKTTVISDTQSESDHQNNIIKRVVWLIAGTILVLLAFRFVLSLMGANITNGFANFIYSASKPFVSPFFSIFSYKNISYGVSHFEAYTLVAMATYAVVAWGITKLATLDRD